jgi:hypothetical protein
MASPNTKATLKEYCLRALGKPVIEINVDPDQCDDRIDEALQYFAEYHMDGVQRTYLKHQITAAEKTRGTTDTTETITDGVDSSISAAWKEQKTWLPLNENIISVLKVFAISSAGSVGNMFDFQYQMRLNDLWDFTSVDLTHYQQLQEHVDMIRHLTEGEIPIRFNVHLDRLYIDMDWDGTVGDDHFIVIECYRKVDPTVYVDVYNDMFLKKYATALIKKQWGANLIKFNGVQMLGGVQMNGEIIYQQADEEIKLLEEQMLNGFGLPADMMMG